MSLASEHGLQPCGGLPWAGDCETRLQQFIPLFFPTTLWLNSFRMPQHKYLGALAELAAAPRVPPSLPRPTSRLPRSGQQLGVQCHPSSDRFGVFVIFVILPRLPHSHERGKGEYPGAGLLPASQPRRSLPCGHADAENAFPDGMPSHLVACLLLFVSRRHLQAEIKALRAARLCRGSHAGALGGGCAVVVVGGDLVAAYLGGARPRCPIPWLLVACPLAPLGLILWDQPKSSIAAAGLAALSAAVGKPSQRPPRQGRGLKTPKALPWLRC